jgi:hypothetical protein
MNTAYSQLARARIRAAVETARHLMHVNHAGLRGRLRELVVRDILRPFLPPAIGIGSGEVVSADDLHSNETDIILYDPWLVPPIAFESGSGLFPLESVLYTIEVKSVLTRAELEGAQAAAARIRSFSAHKPVAVLFAFASDLTPSGKSEYQRYREVFGEAAPELSGICVAGQCYWTKDSHEPEWHHWRISDEYDEILGLLVGINNTTREAQAHRGMPRMARYLIRNLDKLGE